MLFIWSASRATNTALGTMGGTSGVVADPGNGVRRTTLGNFTFSDTRPPPHALSSNESLPVRPGLSTMANMHEACVQSRDNGRECGYHSGPDPEISRRRSQP